MSILGDRMHRDMQLRRFSGSTQGTYLREVEHLVQHLHQPPDSIDQQQLQDYIRYLLTERKLAWSSVNVITAALRFFYTVTLNRKDLVLAIPPRKTPQHLPEILSAPELQRIFDIENPKHRVLLMTTYAAGLRVSEVVRLQVSDIDSNRMMIRVGNGVLSRFPTSRHQGLFERSLRRSVWIHHDWPHLTDNLPERSHPSRQRGQ